MVTDCFFPLVHLTQLILELCRCDSAANSEAIQPLLDRIRPSGRAGVGLFFN